MLNSDEIITDEKFIFDVNENEFAEKVINDSANKIILADFWAPWCGPCKQLTPLLEEIVTDSSDVLNLAKINIDENKQLATQLQIQSIPMVIVFKNKQIVNGFQGLLPKSKIIEFIEKTIGHPIKKNNNKFYQNIVELFKQNKWNEAKNLIESFIAENSSDVKAVSFYIKCLTNLDEFKDLKQFIDSLSDELISNQIIQKEISNFKMLESISKEPTIEILLSNYNKEPNNIENVLILSEKYFYHKQSTEALDLLLNNFSIFKNKDKEKIKKKLLKFFEILGNNHEQTRIYRKNYRAYYFLKCKNINLLANIMTDLIEFYLNQPVKNESIN